MRRLLTHEHDASMRTVAAGALRLAALLMLPIPLSAQQAQLPEGEKTRSEIVPAQEQEWPRGGRTRADVLAELPDAERAFRSNPNDAEAVFNYARLLFESGEFWIARDAILPLIESSTASVQALNMAAKLEYLTGRYDEAVALYGRVREAAAGNLRGQVMADVNRLFAYYQQDRFDKIAEIDFPAGVQLPNATVAGAFEQNPYRLEWHNAEKRSVIPFYVADPLPVFPIEVNGVPIEVIFDTGGDMLILDTEIAEALGIESVATATGTFGGGLQSEIGFGKVDRVQVGDVTMHGVPVTILPTKRFSAGFEPYRIGGILGTAVMRQFLGSLDYENEQLVLRERSPSNAMALRQEMGGRIAAEIPFVLDMTHMMMARGGINGKEGLTYFMDSGLASEHMLAAPIQTLQYLGIPVPETEMPTEGAGGGGGRWASGSFAVERVTLGPLVQSNASGEYGSRTPASYWSEFYIQDALLSHQFLRQYASWTLDFDNMTYIFGPAGSAP